MLTVLYNSDPPSTDVVLASPVYRTAVQWLWRGACSTAGAAGDHVVSPFAATCRAPAFVLQREARTHASGESSYLELLSKAFFGSSRCRQLSNPDLTSPAVSSD